MALVALKIFITIVSFFFLFLLLPILTDTTVIHGGIVSRTRTAASEDADCRQQAEKQG